MITRAIRNIDWPLLALTSPLLIAGLITMKSFGGGSDYFFWRQLIWILAGVFAFVAAANLDWRFLNSGLIIFVYLAGLSALTVLLAFSETSWFNFPIFAIQPSEPMKVLTALILAKYLSRRHIEIAHFRHIAISAMYALAPALLIFFQPDLGSAITFGVLWLGTVMISGVSKRHLTALIIVIVGISAAGWIWVLEPYQKLRITTFLNPYIDPQGAGYNALQAKIAVGSGGVFGRGVGYGSQSRLEFLPEHETDFIFAAFAEEWGLVGGIILLVFFALLIWRILFSGSGLAGNFVNFYATGLALIMIAHFVFHIGMNVGLLPITGLPLSFMSYGGSHMFSLFAGLGVLSSLRKKNYIAMPIEDESG